jgi:hypothetical protein
LTRYGNIGKRTRGKFDTKGGECVYTSSALHVEIDFEMNKGHERDVISDFVGNHLCLNKHIVLPKHVVVLHNTDMLTQDAMLALRKMFEAHANNILFVLTCHKTNAINEALLSRCMFVRCGVPRQSVDPFFEAFYKDLQISSQSFNVHRSLSIVENIIHNEHPDVANGIQTKCRSMLEQMKACNDVHRTVSSIREFARDVLCLQVSLPDMFRTFVALLDGDGKCVIDVVALAAHLDHIAHITHDHNILVERFLVEVYGVIKNI